jgi:hypothetical protein
VWKILNEWVVFRTIIFSPCVTEGQIILNPIKANEPQKTTEMVKQKAEETTEMVKKKADETVEKAKKTAKEAAEMGQKKMQ